MISRRDLLASIASLPAIRQVMGVGSLTKLIIIILSTKESYAGTQEERDKIMKTVRDLLDDAQCSYVKVMLINGLDIHVLEA